jgi:hypothetical protein
MATQRNAFQSCMAYTTRRTLTLAFETQNGGTRGSASARALEVRYGIRKS